VDGTNSIGIAFWDPFETESGWSVFKVDRTGELVTADQDPVVLEQTEGEEKAANGGSSGSGSLSPLYNPLSWISCMVILGVLL
jgi:hypothetical protein